MTHSLLLDNFSGGVNVRESLNQLLPSESANCSNVVLDNRGGFARRAGHTNVVALPGVSGTPAYIFYSEALDLWLCARETSGAPNNFRLHTRPGDLSGSWTDRGRIAGTVSAKAVFTDWPGTTRYCLIGTDVTSGGFGGLYTLDTTPTLTNRSTNEVVALAVWQNKAWTCQHVATTGDSANIANATRLARSAAGDPTTWTDSVDIRDKDGSALTALAVCGGSLLAFKSRSTYRITDSATGAYTTIDPAVGCVNARALAFFRGKIYTWASTGIYEADGIGSLRPIGDKLRPVFGDSNTDTSLICAGVTGDAVIFFTAATANPFVGGDLLWHSPQLGAFVPHPLPSNTQNNITSMAAKGGTLYAAVADGDDLFSLYTAVGASTSKDDATAFTAVWTTPWLLPNSGQLARLQTLTVQGIGGSNVGAEVIVRRDWEGSGTTYDVSTLISSSTLAQTNASVKALGHGSSFQFLIRTNDSGGTFTEFAVRALQLITETLQEPRPGYPKVQQQAGTARGNKPATPPNRNPPPIPPPAP